MRRAPGDCLVVVATAGARVRAAAVVVATVVIAAVAGARMVLDLDAVIVVLGVARARVQRAGARVVDARCRSGRRRGAGAARIVRVLGFVARATDVLADLVLVADDVVVATRGRGSAGAAR